VGVVVWHGRTRFLAFSGQQECNKPENQ